MLVKMALRNLTRQVGRNVISMASIIAGSFVIVIGWGFASGLDENAIRGQIDSVSAHAMVVPADYPESGLAHPVDDAFHLAESDRSWLDTKTEHWTARIIAVPRVIKGRDAMKVRWVGAAPDDESVFPRDSWKIEGRWPSDGEILLAAKPADLLEAGVGDVVTVEHRTVDGGLNAMRFSVSGVLRTGNPMIDNIGAFSTLNSVDEFLRAQGRVTHVATKLADRDQSLAFAEVLAERFEGQTVRTWQAEVASLLEAGQLRIQMFATFGFALLLMAATGIANTVLMAAFERVREIGTLRSMGLQRLGVVVLFGIEGALLGLVGGTLGAGMAGGVNAYYSVNGIDMTALIQGKAEVMSNVPIAATLYLGSSWEVLVVAVVVAVVVSILASVYPALTASNFSPAEAVRPA